MYLSCPLAMTADWVVTTTRPGMKSIGLTVRCQIHPDACFSEMRVRVNRFLRSTLW